MLLNSAQPSVGCFSHTVTVSRAPNRTLIEVRTRRAQSRLRRASTVRNEAGLKQTDVSKRIGKARSFVSNLRGFGNRGMVLAASAGVPRIHFRACEYPATSAYVARIARFLIRTKFLVGTLRSTRVVARPTSLSHQLPQTYSDDDLCPFNCGWKEQAI